mmetsp:Transcript_24757/g.62251  ORF Transcript_24757/g.62251 Transcript_24757/m.62251 type:complete len:354 (-) Transcript_24757:158-1219(-)
MLQRTSSACSHPRKYGVAAVSAIIIGVSTPRWSYRCRDSPRFAAWNVTCSAEQPIPNDMASAWIIRSEEAEAEDEPPFSELILVFASRNLGRSMLTFAPRRSRMFFVSVLNLACGKVISSGTYFDFATGPPTFSTSRRSGVFQNSPTPSRGKQAKVGAISSGRRCASSRERLNRMLSSTFVSAVMPSKGLPGVPSSIHLPYSGIQAHMSASDRPCDLPCASNRCRLCTTSGDRRLIFGFRRGSSGVPSSAINWYSTSSPYLSRSSLMSLASKKTLMNCSTPWSRTYFSFPSARSHGSGTDSTKKPILLNLNLVLVLVEDELVIYILSLLSRRFAIRYFYRLILSLVFCIQYLL